MDCQDYITESVERKKGQHLQLGYRTPEELFDEFLDSVYAAEGCGSIAQDGSQRLPS
uniref:Polymerase n=1 Tax=Dulem virus 67 TaxID=3145778 RepID=A0AAU8ATP8_9VIRU